jgi:hypothetical protein
MDSGTLIFNILLFSGLILFIAGVVLFFVPQIIVKWNAVGNIWIGDPESAKRHAVPGQRLFSADYTIFANHRITGGVMWGLSSLFLIIYVLYH